MRMNLPIALAVFACGAVSCKNSTSQENAAQQAPSGQNRAVTGQAQTKDGQTVGGYYVTDQEKCNLPDLPSTAAEVKGFLSAMPASNVKNVLYKNGQVKIDDFLALSDFYKNGATKTGKDGLDANNIAYISTHGMTRNGVYMLATGEQNKPEKCFVYNTRMQLGDSNLRYLFLSTCQSIKIGTGDDPDAPGEKPYDIWGPFVVRGLRCIYGYSSDVIDDETYGMAFWGNLKKKKTMARAFLDTSWDINPDQIPAVMCFGKDKAEATANMEATKFDKTAPAGTEVSKWMWQIKRSVEENPAKSNVRLNFDEGNEEREMELALRIPVKVKAEPATFSHVLQLDDDTASDIQTEEDLGNLSSAEAISIARSFLQNKSMPGHTLGSADTPSEKAWEEDYRFSEVREIAVADSISKKKKIIERVVVGKPKVGDAPVVSRTAEVRVAVDSKRKPRLLFNGADRMVIDFFKAKASLIRFPMAQIERQRLAAIEVMKARAREIFGARQGVSVEAQIQKVQLGYDVDHLEPDSTALLKFHGAVKVSRQTKLGPVSKIFRISIPVKNE